MVMDPQMHDPQAGEIISGNLPVCAFVQKSHLFKELQKPELEYICRVARLLRFKPDEVIIREGDGGDSLFLIMSGFVRVTTVGKQGTVELGQLTRGAFFGEVSCLTGKPRTATVQAVTDIEVIVLSRVDVDGILKKYPKIRKLMQAMMAGRAREAIEKTRG